MNKNDALIHLSERLSETLRGTPYRRRSEPHRVFTAVFELEAEVNNGGFEQFFSNSAGEMWDAIAPALRTIGAPKMAALSAAAVALFPGGPPPAGLSARRKAVSRASDEVLGEWGRLDQEFLAYPENLTELLFDYVQRHPKEFRALE